MATVSQPAVKEAIGTRIRRVSAVVLAGLLTVVSKEKTKAEREKTKAEHGRNIAPDASKVNSKCLPSGEKHGDSPRSEPSRG